MQMQDSKESVPLCIKSFRLILELLPSIQKKYRDEVLNKIFNLIKNGMTEEDKNDIIQYVFFEYKIAQQRRKQIEDLKASLVFLRESEQEVEPDFESCF